MAEGLFSGLESFGIKGLEGMEVFEDKEDSKKVEKKVAQPVAPKFAEKDFLFDKACTCPVCESGFKSKTVMSSKLKLIGSGHALRPKYEYVDIVKYDVIMCPYCGYTALTKYFPGILESQKKLIREKVSMGFYTSSILPETYSYEDAIERYKVALLNAVIKGGKNSEKAYICLKGMWICEGRLEECEKGSREYEKAEVLMEEFRKNALEGFINAVATESFPMCGMDESTVDYIIAVLSLDENKYEICSKLISKILVSNAANNRLKDRTRDLKEELLMKLKKKK